MGRGVKQPTTKQLQGRVKKAVLGEHVIFFERRGRGDNVSGRKAFKI